MKNNETYGIYQKMINIRRDTDDSFYRYKMPKIVTKTEGRGNGIKTVLTNIVDIAKALNRNHIYLTKFLGYELGTGVKKYCINGHHEQQILQNTLDSFISKFVLCSECMNPETEWIVTKDVVRDCKACGKITNVDSRHKLVAFIIKNQSQTKNEVEYDSDEQTRLMDNEVEKLKEMNNESRIEDWVEDPIETLVKFIESNHDQLDATQIKKFNISNDKAITVLVQTLFDENIIIVHYS